MVSSSHLVPIVAGFLMLVFGIAFAAAMVRGMRQAQARRQWPLAEGRVFLAEGPDGRANTLARVRFKDAKGRPHTLEVPAHVAAGPTGHAKTVEVRVNPANADESVIRPKSDNIGTLGCFAVIAGCFALFGLFALIDALVH